MVGISHLGISHGGYPSGVLQRWVSFRCVTGEEREINNDAQSGPCSPMVGRGMCTAVAVSSHGG